MTNLDKDIKRAKELGLSYGRYKAMSYDPHAVPTIKKTNEKLCPICGKPVEKPRIKFCSDACTKISTRDRKRRQSHERYLSKLKNYK